MVNQAVLAEFEEFNARLLASVASHPHVLGLVWVGSTADRSRVDEWSDHDFFLITEDGFQDAFRSNLSWLPDHDDIRIAVRDSVHGMKVVYDSGLVLEFAVSSPDELSTFSGNVYEVVLDRERIAERMATDVAPLPRIPAPVDPLSEFRLFLVNVLLASGRARRGELLTAGQGLRTHAVRHLLNAVRVVLEGDRPERLDSLDSWRRFETVYPEAGRIINDALSLPVENCGRALLDSARILLADEWTDYPVDEVVVVRRRLGI